MYQENRIHLLTVMDNILLGVQHCVDILPVALATGVANARFLIHFKQKDPSVNSFSHCR